MSNFTDMMTSMLSGGILTLKLFLIVAVLSVAIGIVVAIGKISKITPLRVILSFYTWIFRGTPLLLQLFFIYFGLPAVGIKLEPMTASVIAFTINYAAYLAEIFRAGIDSIDKGQFEAAKVLGMNYRQTMMKIIIPQALRNVIPPICNESTNLIKDTAMVAAIGVGDLLRGAKEVVMNDFTITPFIAAGIVYLAVISVLVLIFRKLENKYVIS
ncbi:amino acid ABC transporter permease [Clostridium fermenticellae]|uniref:Amino acid ABC transporter permease n=1 Tax=Clostridium fermenticellae TaxID=2068654 RepID=A0A386H6A9_9CLOT|nr:amino acid ABC transporter permease [Clostridium fermenticellae]AYD41055.1 amino acid ABC transporter permease [Clostridium fermenticellae]